MLTSVLDDQDRDGSWKLSYEFRPIGSSPQVLTTLALLALSAPTAPDMGNEGKAAMQRGLQWLRDARPDEELQTAALRLILWRRLGLPAGEWEPLVNTLHGAQNADGGWGQIGKAKSDAYDTGQALYALAEAGLKPDHEAVRKAQSFGWQAAPEPRTDHPRRKRLGRDGAGPLLTGRGHAGQNGRQVIAAQPVRHRVCRGCRDRAG
jgi:hypothetical protein